MIRNSIKLLQQCSNVKNSRKIIHPQAFTCEQFDDYHLINSASFSFVMSNKPPTNCSEIYCHHTDSPSNLLKREAIHIFPTSIPTINIQEKYNAHLKKLTQAYSKAFEQCKTPKQLFHMQRRVKSQIRHKCRFIGQIQGRCKHYNMFQSFDEIRGMKTSQQYEKKGIAVKCLPFINADKKIIYPKGPIWLPTNQNYLQMFTECVNKNQFMFNFKKGNILDIGCGSGVLSYILSHKYKSKPINVYAIDTNQKAIETCEVNAANYELKNLYAFKCDITKMNQINDVFKQNRAPEKYNVIVCNPPWIHAKRMKNQSQILDGVYDDKGKVLSSALEVARKKLVDSSSRMFLIYSDLSQILGLAEKSVQQLCKQNNLLIYNKTQKSYPKQLNSSSKLNVYKQSSKIQLFEIGLS